MYDSKLLPSINRRQCSKHLKNMIATDLHIVAATFIQLHDIIIQIQMQLGRPLSYTCG